MKSTFQSTYRFYSFGPYCLDAARLLLYKDSKSIVLAPRFVRTLLILVQNQGIDLDKTYLMDQLWPNTAVEENNLTVIISALRKVFGDDPGQHKYIVTIPGRGYRFVAQVSEGADPGNWTQEPLPLALRLAEPETSVAPVPRKAFAGATRKKLAWLGAIAAIMAIVAALGIFAIRARMTANANSVNALAVLPFESIGFAPDEDYLGLGMADGIVSRLKNTNYISVRPFGGVLAYQKGAYDRRAAGEMLAVNVLLTGTVQKAGNQIALAVKLLRVKDGTILWSEELNGELKQVLSIQDHIAERVIYALTAGHDTGRAAGLRRYTQSPEAYQLYLRGEYFLNHRSRLPADHDLTNAVTNLQAAVDKDPHFGMAYASLASAYNKVSWYLPAEQSFAKAIEAAQKALSIDDQLAEAQRSLAVAKQGYTWDFPAAEVAYRRAIEIDPQDPATHRWYADELLAEGRNEEAEHEWNKAKDLDPYSSMYDTPGRLDFYSRHYKEAFDELQGKQDLDPDASWYVAWIYSFHRAELNMLTGWAATPPSMEAGRQPQNCDLVFEAAAARNRRAVAECVKLVENAPNTPHMSPYTAALLYAALGDKNETFKWLNRAREAHIWNLSYLRVDPRLDSIRDDPRYDSLLASMGLQR